MSLQAKIEDDYIKAMKDKDSAKVETLRLLKSALKNEEIRRQKGLTDEDVIIVIASQIKARHDSIGLYEKGGREELAAKEKAEIEILKHYLPPELSDGEIRAKIDEIIQKTGAHDIKDMGRVMGEASKELKGQADMSKVSEIVKGLLE